MSAREKAVEVFNRPYMSPVKTAGRYAFTPPWRVAKAIRNDIKDNGFDSDAWWMSSLFGSTAGILFAVVTFQPEGAPFVTQGMQHFFNNTSILPKLLAIPVEMGAGIVAAPVAVVLATAAVTTLYGVPAGFIVGCFKATKKAITDWSAHRRLSPAEKIRALPAAAPKTLALAPAQAPLPKQGVTQSINGFTVHGYGPDVQVLIDAQRKINAVTPPFEYQPHLDNKAAKTVRAELRRAAKVFARKSVHVYGADEKPTDELPFFRPVFNEVSRQSEPYILRLSDNHVVSEAYEGYLKGAAEIDGAGAESVSALLASAQKLYRS